MINAVQGFDMLMDGANEAMGSIQTFCYEHRLRLSLQVSTNNYSRLCGEFNSLLERFNTVSTRFNLLRDKFNVLVDRFNGLLEKSRIDRERLEKENARLRALLAKFK